MDTQAIRARMPTWFSGHVPSTIRNFRFNIFDSQPKVSTLGFHIPIPNPSRGQGHRHHRRGHRRPDRAGRIRCVLDKALVTDVPMKAPKCRSYPPRRRFDGLRADTARGRNRIHRRRQAILRYSGSVLGCRASEAADPQACCPELARG